MHAPTPPTRLGSLPAALALLLLLLALLPAPLPAQALARAEPPAMRGYSFDHLRAQIRRIMAQHDLPSLVVAVAKDGRVLWEEGFGMADLERQIPATPDTPYSLASISKPITATAILRLVEQGRLELDRPVDDYLGASKLTGLAGSAADATVRRVLSHTAGLPLHYEFFYEGEAHPARGTDAGIARYGILVHPPGAVYEYSNLGYGVLDRIIEQVTHQRYEEYLRSELFAPLGMSQSFVGSEAAQLEGAAVRYDSRLRPIRFYDFDHRGGSAVFASARDLLRFGMFHLGNGRDEESAVLRESSVQLMQRTATPIASSQDYGLGWLITEDDGGYRRVYHTGGMPGVSTVLNLFPGERLAIVVMTNRSDRVVSQVAEEIAATLLPGYAERLRARRSAGAPLPARYTPTRELLGEWSGTLRTYEGTLPFLLVFQRDGDVHVRLGGQLPTLLSHVALRDGNLTGRFAGLIPTEDAGQHRHTVLLNLRLRPDGTLSGMATAWTPPEPLYFALSSYVELTKLPARR